MPTQPQFLNVFFDPMLPINSPSLKLGNVVLNAKFPWQDFAPQSISLSKDDITITPFNLIHNELNVSQKSGFHIRLTEYLNGSFGKNEGKKLRIDASTAQTYVLNNSGLLFRRLCENAGTRKWLYDAINQGYRPYFIVGFHTVKDAGFTMALNHDFGADASTEVPLANIIGMVSSAGVGVMSGVIAPGVTAEVEVGAGRHQKHNSEVGFTAPGERVIAVQYRKLKYRWFSSRSVDSSYLEVGNRWTIFANLGTKGGAEDDDDDEDEDEDDGALDDSVEFDFEDNIDPSDPAIDGTSSFTQGDDLVVFAQ